MLRETIDHPAILNRVIGGYFDEKNFQPPGVVIFSIAFIFCCSIVNLAQNREKFVISAKAGGINAITGQASVHARGD